MLIYFTFDCLMFAGVLRLLLFLLFLLRFHAVRVVYVHECVCARVFVCVFDVFDRVCSCVCVIVFTCLRSLWCAVSWARCKTRLQSARSLWPRLRQADKSRGDSAAARVPTRIFGALEQVATFTAGLYVLRARACVCVCVCVCLFVCPCACVRTCVYAS